jgi:RNA polymerase sigma-70 factor (ECF subfamily)
MTPEAEDASTARLVRCAQAGHEPSFEVLCARYRDRVHAYLAALVDDPHDAEDVTQDVLERARTSLHRYRERAGVPWRAWLFAIARNRALTHVARRSRVDLVPPSELDSRRDGPGAAAAGETGWIDDDVLLALVEELSPAQRRALRLRYELDLSVSEVAGLLASSEGSVAVLLHRARNRLRAGLA